MTALTVGEAMALFDCEGVQEPELDSRFRLRVAGAELNFAIGLTRLGVPVRWISRVGQDVFGQAVLAVLDAENLDTSYVRRDDRAPTGIFFKWRTVHGSSVLYSRRGSAASLLETGDLTSAVYEGVRLVHLTGITMALSESARKLVTELATQARKRELIVTFDPNWRSQLWPSPAVAADAFREIFPLVDYVLCGLQEGSSLFGTQTVEELRQELQRAGAGDAVIRIGARGAMAAGQEVPPTRLVEVVDEVGAGDAFAAGFAYGLLAGWDETRATRMANLIAAAALEGSGDWETLPFIDELEDEVGSLPSALREG